MANLTQIKGAGRRGAMVAHGHQCADREIRRPRAALHQLSDRAAVPRRPSTRPRTMPRGCEALPERAAVALPARAVLRRAVLVLRLQHPRGAPARADARAYADTLLEREIDRVAAGASGGGWRSRICTGAAARRTTLPADRLIGDHGAAPRAVRLRRRRRDRDRDRSAPLPPRPARRRSPRWASPAPASACRISTRRCRRAINRVQSFEQTAGCATRLRARGHRLAQSRPDLRPAAPDRGECRAHGAAGARSRRPTASRCSATPMCRG